MTPRMADADAVAVAVAAACMAIKLNYEVWSPRQGMKEESIRRPQLLQWTMSLDDRPGSGAVSPRPCKAVCHCCVPQVPSESVLGYESLSETFPGGTNYLYGKSHVPVVPQTDLGGAWGALC